MNDFKVLSAAEIAELSSADRRIYMRKLKEYNNQKHVSSVLTSQPTRENEEQPFGTEPIHSREVVSSFISAEEPVTKVHTEEEHTINSTNTINAINSSNTVNTNVESMQAASVTPKVEQQPTMRPAEKKPKITNDKSLFSSICFETTFERADYIRRMSFRNHLTKEEMYAALFEDTMSLEIDFKDPLYRSLTERSKKDTKITTRLNKDLLQRMRDRAADNYMNIGAYINYVIQKHMEEHDN
jgi:predicted DNA binding CopG/RHH family protein